MVAGVVLSALALSLAVVSLLWQAVSFQQSGAKWEVHAKLGMAGGGGLMTGPALTVDLWNQAIRQGMTQPMFVVEVRNVGRLGGSVTSCQAKTSEGFGFSEAGNPIGPNLPHRIEAQDSWSFGIPLRGLVAMLQVSNSKSMAAWAEVATAAGGIVRSKATLPISAEIATLVMQ